MAGPSVTVEMSADELKLLRSIQKIVDKNKELDKSLDDAGKKGTQAAKKIDEGFASNAKIIGDAKQEVLNFASSFASVGGAVALVTATIDKMSESIEKAKQFTEGMKNARANLASVAKDSADMIAMEQRSFDLAMKYAIDPSLAQGLMFEARSSGWEPHMETAARYAAMFDPTAVSAVASKVPLMFQGKIDSAQALNAVYAAAQQSNLDFPNMARAMPSVSFGGGMLGATPEETMATLSVLAGVFKSGDVGATYISGFGSHLANQEGFKGLGFVESVKRLQAMPEEERAAILGTGTEVTGSYRYLSENLAQIEERTRLIEQEVARTGTAQDMISLQEQRYYSTENSRSMFLRDQQRIAEQLTLEREFSAEAMNAESRLLRERNADWQRSRIGGAVGAVFSAPAYYISPESAAAAQAFGSEVPGIAADPSMGRVAAAGLRAGLRGASSQFDDNSQFRRTAQGMAEYIPESFSPTEFAEAVAGRILKRIAASTQTPSTLAQPDVDK